jgi:hypothetical protein
MGHHLTSCMGLFGHPYPPTQKCQPVGLVFITAYYLVDQLYFQYRGAFFSLSAQRKGTPGRLASDFPRSEPFIVVVLTRILLGSLFRARPCALNPNKYLSTQHAQTSLV